MHINIVVVFKGVVKQDIKLFGGGLWYWCCLTDLLSMVFLFLFLFSVFPRVYKDGFRIKLSYPIQTKIFLIGHVKTMLSQLGQFLST